MYNSNTHLISAATMASQPNVFQPKSSTYFNMKSNAMLVFSIFNFVLCLISVTLATAVIVTFNGGFSFSYGSTFDVIGHGIWAGIFYLITGFLGYSASYKKTKSLLVSTLVFSVFSLLSSIVAIALSAAMADYIPYYYSDYLGYCLRYYPENYYDYYKCEVWYILEWTLMGFSALAFIDNTVVLSLACHGLCSGRKPNATNQNQLAMYAPYQPQQGVIYIQQPQRQPTLAQPIFSSVIGPHSLPQGQTTATSPTQPQMAQSSTAEVVNDNKPATIE